ncbi:hypothetical protein C0989_000979 [Termitomyces sp. Mn162]|nr:hypothetical protein C0989_000979 [Termitomyces sp. Mn162]
MLNKLIFGPQGFALGVRATAGTITGLMIIGNMLMRTRTQSTRAEDAEMVRVPVKTLLMDIPYMVFVFSYAASSRIIEIERKLTHYFRGVLLTLGIYYPTVPALFGQPISGALLTGRFIWWRATVFSGSCLLAGAILMVYSRWLFLKREGKDQVFKKGIFRHIMGTSQDAT